RSASLRRRRRARPRAPVGSERSSRRGASVQPSRARGRRTRNARSRRGIRRRRPRRRRRLRGGAMTIHLDAVSVRLGDAVVLRDVSLELDARTVAVIGENGSGKSTFARLIGGLVGRTGGTMRILGLDPATHAKELQRRTALIFSNPDAQILMPTVAEDVAFSLRADRLPPA